jgi:hypothetical protein
MDFVTTRTPDDEKRPQKEKEKKKKKGYWSVSLHEKYPNNCCGLATR